MKNAFLIPLWFVLALSTLILLLLEGDIYTVITALVAWSGGLVTVQMWRSRRKHAS